MRRLVEAAGIDYDQWLALTRVALKLDFRQTSFGRNAMGRDTSGAWLLVGQLIFYTVLGAFMAAFVLFANDRFLAATTVVAYVMFMVGTVVLLDHNSALTSPVDYPVLGYRPVSSRTYFAARLANVLLYTTAITTAAAYLPLVALFYRYGAGVGLAGVAAFYGASITVVLVVLVAYASMLRAFGPAALKRALSYVQLLMSFVVYGGYFVVAEFVSRAAIQSMTLERSPWTLLLPPVWFASYLDLAGGDVRLVVVLPVLASILLIAVMAMGLGGRLSLEYSERIGAIVSSAAPRTAREATSRRIGGRWFRRGEHRAMALLIRSQFRNDQRFRMAVLSILPLTLVYVFMGVSDGGLQDPFVRSPDAEPFSLVTVAVLMFPSMLKMSLSYSESFRASWVFFAAPADRAAVIRAAKNVLIAFFLVPYMAFVTAVYLYFVPAFWHVVVHMTFLGLLSHLCLQILVLADPDLPFARPPTKGRAPTFMMIFMFVIFGASVFLQIFSPVIYRSVTRAVVAFGFVGLGSLAVDRLTRLRVGAQVRALEFQG